MSEGGVAPIIIKKVKKGGHGGHHGGAWKVAYADFVTAMMAFFLLLWLLNSTTDEQKQGLADYFSPASISKSYSGSGGAMGGMSPGQPGGMRSDSAPSGITIALPDPESESGGESESSAEDKGVEAEAGSKSEEEEERRRILAERESSRFDLAEAALRQAVQDAPELQVMADSMIIDQTDEGLRIQIIDRAGQPMFPSGSAEMYHTARRLFDQVAASVAELPNRIAVKGHTDATPYVAGKGYSNWELSADRANASRRVLVEAGVPPERFATVSGQAGQDPLEPQDPFSPRNRRISVILLREAPIALGANSGLKSGDRGD
jgi:chemotaxis protein MotB